MTLQDLRERIDELCDTCDDPSSVMVRLALQPSYPMIGSIQNICMEHGKDDENNTLWIACSNNEDYGCPGSAWDDSDIWDDEEDE